MMLVESRHYFIYRENSQERRELLQTIAGNHPIVLDDSLLACVYMEDSGLPEVANPVAYFDNIQRLTCAREFLSFSIAHQRVSQFAS